MDRQSLEDFCIDNVNRLNIKQRQEILKDLVRVIPDKNIDSSNSDGTRIYMEDIDLSTLERIYEKIKAYLE
jgi:hypothetical protein